MSTYIKSNKIHVFPCAYRGSKFDPEAKLNTEYNYTNIAGRPDSYIISWDDNNNLKAVIKGYYFEIADFKKTSGQIFLGIKLTDISLTDGVYTKILGSFEATVNAGSSLDVGSGDDLTQYDFTGLRVFYDKAELDSYSKNNDKNNDFYHLQILENGQIYYHNLLPKITSGFAVETIQEGSTAKATGEYSHAEGDGTLAAGYASHAEGLGKDEDLEWDGQSYTHTGALGDYSHTEGEWTTAIGYASHAEGNETTVLASFGGHAEGYRTTVLGYHSHAEGVYSGTGGYASHAEGKETAAYGDCSHTEGYQSIAYADYSHAEGKGTITGIEYNFEDKGNENTSEIGQYSHAEGIQTVASGEASHAEGIDSKATGEYSHTEGAGAVASGNTAHAEGYITTAEGLVSHTEGANTNAKGDYSHAEGNSTHAKGEASHTEGWNTRAEGRASHASGEDTNAIGIYSYAEGKSTSAKDEASHAEGRDTQANAPYSHAEGHETTANGEASHTEGSNTQANGEASHAEGYRTNASGNYSHAEGGSSSNSNDRGAIGIYSHAEGYNTVASGGTSHAEGNSTTASGAVSHAEGNVSIAYANYSHAEGGGIAGIGGNPTKGQYSHAEGSGTKATGEASHAEGQNTYAAGKCSHASGYYTKAWADYQTVIGKYNVGKTTTLFEVGNGEDENNRANAFEVKKGGDIVCTGNITFKPDGSSQVKIVERYLHFGVLIIKLNNGATNGTIYLDYNAMTANYTISKNDLFQTAYNYFPWQQYRYISAYLQIAGQKQKDVFNMACQDADDNNNPYIQFKGPNVESVPIYENNPENKSGLAVSYIESVSFSGQTEPILTIVAE